MHPVAVVSDADRAWLDAVGDCETRGYSRGASYRVNTGNGFYGRYQFTMGSWASVGGRGRPDLATAAQQDRLALRLRAEQGTGAWPVCG